jgi:hypothetical protein
MKKSKRAKPGEVRSPSNQPSFAWVTLDQRRGQKTAAANIARYQGPAQQCRNLYSIEGDATEFRFPDGRIFLPLRLHVVPCAQAANEQRHHKEDCQDGGEHAPDYHAGQGLLRLGANAVGEGGRT